MLKHEHTPKIFNYYSNKVSKLMAPIYSTSTYIVEKYAEEYINQKYGFIPPNISNS